MSNAQNTARLGNQGLGGNVTAAATVTGGNIALGSTSVVAKVLHLTWSGTAWYPSY